VVDGGERVLQFEVHTAGFEIGFGGTFTFVDYLEVALEGLANFAALIEVLALAEIFVLDVERPGVGARAVFATSEE
jgi:hypothetical protein